MRAHDLARRARLIERDADKAKRGVRIILDDEDAHVRCLGRRPV